MARGIGRPMAILILSDEERSYFPLCLFCIAREKVSREKV